MLSRWNRRKSAKIKWVAKAFQLSFYRLYLMSPGSLGQFSSPSHRWTAHIRWEEPSQVICSALNTNCGKKVKTGRGLKFKKERFWSQCILTKRKEYLEVYTRIMWTKKIVSYYAKSCQMNCSQCHFAIRLGNEDIRILIKIETPSRGMKDFRSGK